MTKQEKLNNFINQVDFLLEETLYKLKAIDENKATEYLNKLDLIEDFMDEFNNNFELLFYLQNRFFSYSDFEFNYINENYEKMVNNTITDNEIISLSESLISLIGYSLQLYENCRICEIGDINDLFDFMIEQETEETKQFINDNRDYINTEKLALKLATDNTPLVTLFENEGIYYLIAE